MEILLRRECMKARANTLLAGARGYLLFRVGVLATLTLLLTLVCASTAWSAIFTVTNTNDSGPGSLRAAIEQANANAGADEIVFADGVSGTITLASALPTVTDGAGLLIDGGGDVTVSGNRDLRVFAVDPGAAFSLRNLIVSDGHDGDYGGGIINEGTLTVTDSTFSGNHAADSGAGIANFGTLTVSGSTFSGNSGDFDGGGIYNEGELLKVTNSTFFGNKGGFGGGGIISYGGPVEVVNSTISNNTSFEGAGGIYGGMFTLRNTIVANNAGGNCGWLPARPPVVDGGYNVDDDGTCGFTQATGSLPNTNPLLDSDGLQDNGGPTQTIALQPESPAVDLVGQGACPPPTTDQRGVQRPQGESCDSGAFELVQQTPKPTTKEECKKGGYKEFGFKNQGRCIAFVNRSARDQ
jgi:fibronectin-binding autotransporter adhesin